MLNSEIFKPVPNFEGLYEISNLGRVKSLSRKTIRKKMGNVMQKETILKAGKNKKRLLSSSFDEIRKQV